MIFLVFIILTILGIGIVVAHGKICEKYDYKGENNTKFVSFVWNNDEPIIITGLIVAVLSGLIAFCLLFAIATVQITADGDKAVMEQRYKALVYKSQTESIRDEFGIVNKEYIDEIQEWNENLAKYQSFSHNIWISIFYPKRKYDGLEVIDLESIKMKN